MLGPGHGHGEAEVADLGWQHGPGRGSPVRLAFSPDGTFLAAARRDEVWLWHAPDLER